jgi:hypothetical protein
LNVREALNGFGTVSAGIDEVTSGLRYAKTSPPLRGRLQEDADGNARAAYLSALVELQSQPIGFMKGGFGESSDDNGADAQMLLRAFNHQL